MIKERFTIGASPDAKSIRKQVYELELGESGFLDEYDNTCWELVLYLDDSPISTGRIRPIDPETYIIEKLAVIKPIRGQTVGTYTVKYLTNKILSLGGRYALVHCDSSLFTFFWKLGFSKSQLPLLPLGKNEVEMSKFLPKKYRNQYKYR